MKLSLIMARFTNSPPFSVHGVIISPENNFSKNESRNSIYTKWTSEKDFNVYLKEFNERRIFAQRGEYNPFLTQRYPETWKNRGLNAEQYISRQKSKYAIFFSYQADKDILFNIFPSRIRIS